MLYNVILYQSQRLNYRCFTYFTFIFNGKNKCIVTSVLDFFTFCNYICRNKNNCQTKREMSKNSINDRISELIEFLDITPTAFADEIGIQRSGLSHIMKGRNKPSLDVVQKIINRFPEINILWLVNGTGAMSSSIPSVINLQQKPQTVKKEEDNALKNTLFDTDNTSFETPLTSTAPTHITKPQGKYTHEDYVVDDAENNAIPPQDIRRCGAENDDMQELRNNVGNMAGTRKKITKIVVFFDDNSYQEMY